MNSIAEYTAYLVVLQEVRLVSGHEIINVLEQGHSQDRRIATGNQGLRTFEVCPVVILTLDVDRNAPQEIEQQIEGRFLLRPSKLEADLLAQFLQNIVAGHYGMALLDHGFQQMAGDSPKAQTG